MRVPNQLRKQPRMIDRWWEQWHQRWYQEAFAENSLTNFYDSNTTRLFLECRVQHVLDSEAWT